jgi:hypothetical protein
VRERVDPSDGEREVGIVLVGEAEAAGLDAEPEPVRIAVEGRSLGSRREELDLVRVQHTLVNEAALLPAADELEHGADGLDDDHPDWFGQDRAADDDAGLEVSGLHVASARTPGGARIVERIGES